ncbi:T9SS type A sorting domain-containing protein [Flavobacterium sp. RSB2_4_14]|uniref:T9SS type A sorting domain-containing protein n=1 Tax=Flavobacterium sp. RSB2_4_14 TaxID=3447665 RepID=UPI003F3F4C3E
MKTKLLYLFITLFAWHSNAQVISMIGSTSPSGSWSVDTNMNTTDNVTYTLNNVTVTTATDPATTGLKFRQDGLWTNNWGNANFPSGTATLNGANIMTVAGTYDVTFNRVNGTYTFIPSGFPSIGIWGPAVNSQLGYGAPDVDMVTTDGITYTLSGFYFSSGNCYFRQDNATTNQWGSTTFPTGTAVLNGPSLFVPGGEWVVTFNRITGAYSFDYNSVGILGSGLNGFNVADTDLTTADGFNYTLAGLALTTGEVKFRKNNDWATNWGAAGFPTGTGTQDGPNIPVTAGTYNISIEIPGGNYVFTNTLSTASTSMASVKVYPNPSASVWNISHSDTISSVQLMDSLGKVITSYAPNATEFQVDGSGLSAGVYFVKITAGLDFAVQKIIKN